MKPDVILKSSQFPPSAWHDLNAWRKRVAWSPSKNIPGSDFEKKNAIYRRILESDANMVPQTALESDTLLSGSCRIGFGSQGWGSTTEAEAIQVSGLREECERERRPRVRRTALLGLGIFRVRLCFSDPEARHWNHCCRLRRRGPRSRIGCGPPPPPRPDLKEPREQFWSIRKTLPQGWLGCSGNQKCCVCQCKQNGQANRYTASVPHEPLPLPKLEVDRKPRPFPALNLK